MVPPLYNGQIANVSIIGKFKHQGTPFVQRLLGKHMNYREGQLSGNNCTLRTKIEFCTFQVQIHKCGAAAENVPSIAISN